MTKARKPISNVRPFRTDKQIADFASWFLRDRAQGFRKDVDICLTANKKGDHAYLPALMTCFSFLDFLSGLYAGKVEGHGKKEFLIYCGTFLDSTKYAKSDLAILYEGFRHKLAHLSRPYTVFDTSTKRSLPNQTMRIAWTINAARCSKPLQLKKCDSSQMLLRTQTPWPVSYDHRITISVRSFAIDSRKTLLGNNGYIQKLRSSDDLRRKFACCMSQFYPR